MKKVALNIISSHKIYAPVKIEQLDEKKLVPNMMMRRRLTRNSKVMIYLADRCGFENGKIVYGSCYSELEETSKIANSVVNDEVMSPTSFQNSVYNTAPSYFSLLKKDTDEIITISSGMKTSLDTLKTAALQALISKERIFCVSVECLNIKNIQEVNRCAQYLEAGAGIVVELAENSDKAKEIQKSDMHGIIGSLKDIFGVVEMHKNGTNKIVVEL